MDTEVKKVGILTLCWGRNYGGVLQSYALQETIRRLGYECSMINFRRNTKLKDGTNKTGFPLFVWKVVTLLCRIFCKYTTERLRAGMREKKYVDFFNQSIDFTDEIYNDESDFFENPPLFDAYVVGSDVVWYPRKERQFMLLFAPAGTRRISYAASFGRDEIPDDMRDYMGRGITQFDSVSVRETQGVQLVKELTGRNAEWVLDPTLLFSANEWRAVSSKNENHEPYILSYFLNKTPYMRKVVSHLAKTTGLKVISIEGGNWEFQNPRMKALEFIKDLFWGKKVRRRYDVGPWDFVDLFDGASYVVTNSFHGMVFAIIFQKTFISILRKGMGVRQKSFAEMLSLKRGILREGDALPSLEVLKQDYDAISDKLLVLKQRSLEYLKQALL